jgi:hypothetical protein
MIAGSWLLRRVVRKEYISYCSALPHVFRYVPFVCDLTLNWHYQCNTSVTNVFCVLLLLPLVKGHLCQGERLPHSKNRHIDPYDYWITIIVGNIVVNMTSISVVFLTVHATLQFVFTLNNYILAWCLQNMITKWTFPLFTNVANIYIVKPPNNNIKILHCCLRRITH